MGSIADESRHRCPECRSLSIRTPEEEGAIHIECPVCLSGSVFRDARGGYECSACDQRFLIHGEPYQGYAGPHGPIPWNQRPLPLWSIGVMLGVYLVVIWTWPNQNWVFLLLAWVVMNRHSFH